MDALLCALIVVIVAAGFAAVACHAFDRSDADRRRRLTRGCVIAGLLCLGGLIVLFGFLLMLQAILRANDAQHITQISKCGTDTVRRSWASPVLMGNLLLVGGTFCALACLLSSRSFRWSRLVACVLAVGALTSLPHVLIPKAGFVCLFSAELDRHLSANEELKLESEWSGEQVAAMVRSPLAEVGDSGWHPQVRSATAQIPPSSDPRCRDLVELRVTFSSEVTDAEWTAVWTRFHAEAKAGVARVCGP